MAARIRRLATNVVRLNVNVFVHVQRLARLAGVSPSEVVEFVLMEVLQDDPGEPVPAATRPVPVPALSPGPGIRKAPARVIPIRRGWAHRASVGCPAGSLGEMRRHAIELCQRSQEARCRAESVRRKAAHARAQAQEALTDFGWS